MKIAVIGLGKLGSVMAAVLADKGYVVVGVDSTSTFVEAINEAKAPVEEPGLDDLIKKNRHRLSATADHEEAVAGAEVTFIVVPTPSDAEGTFSLRYVLPAMDAIGRVLRRKTDFHLAVCDPRFYRRFYPTVAGKSVGQKVWPGFRVVL
jgi:UDPglucose 6-dehydrogenase